MKNQKNISTNLSGKIALVAGATRGRLDLLVNDIWGGDPLTEWNVPFWQPPFAKRSRHAKAGHMDPSYDCMACTAPHD